MTHAADALAGAVLAAGSGTRLRPLTLERPKALCPVDGVASVDLALSGCGRSGSRWERSQSTCTTARTSSDAHLPAAVHRSNEAPVALGTAGAIGALRSWIDGRDVVVANADAWLDRSLDLDGFVQDWDHERTRLWRVTDRFRGDFGDLRYCGVALIPAATARALAPAPSGLYEVSWRQQRGRRTPPWSTTEARFVDCGTPADYLAANLAASGGRSVVAMVRGRHRCAPRTCGGWARRGGVPGRGPRRRHPHPAGDRARPGEGRARPPRCEVAPSRTVRHA